MNLLIGSHPNSLHAEDVHQGIPYTQKQNAHVLTLWEIEFYALRINTERNMTGLT